jgi:hypothetical protein
MTWKKGGSTLEEGPTMGVSPVLLLWKDLTVTRSLAHKLTNFGHPALLSARSNPARRILPLDVLTRSHLCSTNIAQRKYSAHKYSARWCILYWHAGRSFFRRHVGKSGAMWIALKAGACPGALRYLF